MARAGVDGRQSFRGVAMRNGRIVSSGPRSGGGDDGESQRSSGNRSNNALRQRIAARTEARRSFNRAVNA